MKQGRRQFLRCAAGGAGVLGTSSLLGQTPLIAADGSRPQRVVFMFYPDGMLPAEWWTDGSGGLSDYTLSATSSLNPLLRHRADVTIVRGLEHRSTLAHAGNYHEFSIPHVLTGGPLSEGMTVGGITTPGGISIDQFLGTHLGAATAHASYRFGVAAEGNSQIQRELSFSERGRGLKATSNPLDVLDDLFGGVWGAGVSYDLPEDHTPEQSCGDTRFGTIDEPPASSTLNESERRRKILFELRAQGRRLVGGLAPNGTQAIEAHLSALDELERQLSTGTSTGVNLALDGELLGCLENGEGYVGFARGVSDARRSHWLPRVSRLQRQLLTGALAEDRTRVALLQYGASNSLLRFPFLPIAPERQWEDHHSTAHLVHDGTEDVKAYCREAIRQITHFFVEEFSRLIDLLKSVPDGDGQTLFDNTTVVLLSDMSDGGRHSPHDLPILVAGGACTGFRTGGLLELSPRPFADLLITLCHGLGVGVDRFGEQAIGGPLGGAPGFLGPIDELLV